MQELSKSRDPGEENLISDFEAKKNSIGDSTHLRTTRWEAIRQNLQQEKSDSGQYPRTAEASRRQDDIFRRWQLELSPQHDDWYSNGSAQCPRLPGNDLWVAQRL